MSKGDDFDDLPDEVREVIAPHLMADVESLAAIGIAIGKKRDEAKAARSTVGVEQTWKECEEAYVGVDEANRNEFTDGKWSKPNDPSGPVTTGKEPKDEEKKSNVFIRLTARYVDAGAAKLGEILLPADDKAFSFTEMPVPELIKASKDKSQVVHDGLGNTPLWRPLKPHEIAPAIPALPAPAVPPPSGATAPVPAAAPSPGPAGALGASPAPQAGAATPPPGMAALTVADLAEEKIEHLRAQAKAAETRVYDWLIECQYRSEMRKVIFDSARIGVGILKGPVPKNSRGIAILRTATGVEIIIKDKVVPDATWVDPWNIFPDPACGEEIHEGDYCFERDYMSERQLTKLKDNPEYLSAQIDKVIEEGPDKINATDDQQGGRSRTLSERKNRFEVWYYYGILKREEMDCICAHVGKPMDEKQRKKTLLYVIVTLINDTVIRAVINPLDSGSFPYHSVPWQRRLGSWAGIGVGEQLRTPQRMLNAANRAMLNNAGKASGSQFIIDQDAIIPADGSLVITPDKIWYKKNTINGPVQNAFMTVEIPNTTEQLMKIIEFSLQLAEESTSIPLITQGQSGETTPDTYGAAQLQNNNANQLLRSIGYAFDDYITEPFIRQMYEWFLLDDEVPNEEKGEFKINAHGSVTLIERAIQDQTITQMGPMVVNPIYGMDPKKWSTQLLRTKRLNPYDFKYTPEEQKRMDATPPPPAPPVQVATINAQVKREQIVANQTSDQRSLQNEAQIAAAANALEGTRLQADQHETLTNATVALHELQMKRETAILEYANLHRISLERAKADLAKTAMTLHTQEKLNAVDNAVKMHQHRQKPPKSPKAVHPQRSTPALAKPPAQVPGRAGNGQQFEQTPP